MESILISVHGVYCNFYELGKKTVEVRKGALTKEVSRVYIYNTEKKVLQFMATLDKQETILIRDISEDQRMKAGLKWIDILSYATNYNGTSRSKLTFLTLSNIGKFFPQINLKALQQKGINPPVGYRYLTNDEVNFIHEFPF